jgi:hypothetical protein
MFLISVEMPPPLDVDKFPFKDYATQFLSPHANIAFQRDPLSTSLHPDTTITKDAVAISSLISCYTWNTSADNKKKLTENEGIDIVKTLLEHAIKKPKLRNEVRLFMHTFVFYK